MTRQNDFHHDILNESAHRPWPMPAGAWLMTQTWHDLLFAHWRVAEEVLRARVPAPFEIDQFEGASFVGVVPFRMTNVAPRGVPALPWISAFPELNVRTYVRCNGRPGVYFFSLDATNPVAVGIARALVHLPYFTAAMACETADGWVAYRSERAGAEGAAKFSGRYRPTGPPHAPATGTLEHFLTERYCLFTTNKAGEPFSLDIHHPSWALQPAEAEISVNTMAAAAGIELPATVPLLHFSRRQDMVGWGLRREP